MTLPRKPAETQFEQTWKPGQAHPKREQREWGGFSERVRSQQQQAERDAHGRRKREG